MENQISIKDDNVDNLTLQEYADLHCGGDRYRAIYELIGSDVPGSFDRYLHELSQDEARFILCLIEDSATKICGGQRAFDKAAKANALAEKLGIDIDDFHSETPNPFAKKLILSVIGIFAAIAVAVVIGVMNRRLDMNIAYIGEALIGLAAMSLAERIIQFFRFQRLKKLAVDFPTLEIRRNHGYCPLPYEEAFARFRKKYAPQPDIDKVDAEHLLSTARKRIIKALLWLLGYVVAIVVSILVAYGTGLIGGIACSFGLIAFFGWQIVPMFRCLVKAKAISSVKDADEQQKKSMELRQNLLALFAMFIAGVYLIVAVAGCLISVMISLQT